jgi:methylglutaconyl-CoA hydratase
MTSYETISVHTENDILNIILNRATKSNAINLPMVREITEVISSAESNRSIRFILFSSTGKNFCSGADLEWMLNSSQLSPDENNAECEELANMFYAVYNSSKITISLIDGACVGGGIGIAVSTDFALAASSSFFIFSEVRLGLVPAVILPYVVNRIGKRVSKQLMLTGEKILGEQALKLGLVDDCIDPSDAVNTATELIDVLRKGEQQAQLEIKRFVNNIKPGIIDGEVISKSAKQLALTRISERCQIKISEFLMNRDKKSE